METWMVIVGACAFGLFVIAEAVGIREVVKMLNQHELKISDLQQHVHDLENKSK
jgi:hypothetical protein